MQAAIFDMDGTLLDSMGVWLRLVPDFMREHGIRIDPAIARGMSNMGLEEAAEYLAQNHSLGMTAASILRQWDETMLAAYLGEVAPLPYALEYLKRLRALGVRTAVATLTTHALADRALAHHGMNSLFDCILTTEDVGNIGKERPDLFLEAAHRLDAPVDGCVVFEDSLYAIQTSVSAGFPTCAIAGRENEEAQMRRLSRRFVRGFDELLVSLEAGDFPCARHVVKS